MERLSTAGASVVPLERGWRMMVCDSGSCRTPLEALATDAWHAAPVPGTVAEALEGAALFDRANPVPLQDRDCWYVLELEENPGDAVLRFEGLATVADVYFNGEKCLSVESMFETHDLPVTLTGKDQIAICFKAVSTLLDQPGPRARWRPRMFDHQGLRLLRTTLLGHMPGWCPSVQAVGPFRPISLVRSSRVTFHDLELRSTLIGKDIGRLDLRFHATGGGAFVLHCSGRQAAVERHADGFYHARLELPGIEPWLPHTHGNPSLHEVVLQAGEERHSLRKTGFRRITVDKGQDGKGFGLVINDAPVFCRGAVWTNVDLVRLAFKEADYRPILEQAVSAGMNMIRIGGTMTYESPAFFRLCDEMGILVWQDLMFANFDYPVKDESFLAHVEREVADQMVPIMASPSLAVICGGSEMHQQAAMLGLPRMIWEGRLTEEILPGLATRYCPDIPYVPNSPFGGAMPFSPNEGVTHYYGVGAYERPLEDARRANVRFSAESLAFSQVPARRTLEAHLPTPAVHDPRWKARVPRDRDASWDFEDTRDHYLRNLYGFDPARLRREDPERYLDFSRAVTGEVSEAVFAEWRRVGSSCRGGLVWTMKDFLPGAGWGVIDATGEPKPVYYALARAFRPIQILLTDEGTNGLDVHVLNERAEQLDAVLEIACLRDGGQPVVKGWRTVTLAPGGSTRLAATDLFGALFDTTYAFRFGPPSHDVTVARLRRSDGDRVIAEAFHFPLGRACALHAAQIEASLVQDEEGWSLLLSADRFAQSVSIESETHRAIDDWFHLAPGETKAVRLTKRAGTGTGVLPTGTIRTLGTRQTWSF